MTGAVCTYEGVELEKVSWDEDRTRRRLRNLGNEKTGDPREKNENPKQDEQIALQSGC